MATLAIRDQLRNLRLQTRKLTHYSRRHPCDPDLIRALERPVAMAWHAIWSCVNCRGEI